MQSKKKKKSNRKYSNFPIYISNYTIHSNIKVQTIEKMNPVQTFSLLIQINSSTPISAFDSDTISGNPWRREYNVEIKIYINSSSFKKKNIYIYQSSRINL